jgi:predicted ribosome quality control (RQC) complex YloA/Tae2 family protein
MVISFTSTAVDPPATIYMGRDKFENEQLIKYPMGSEYDVWFHVDRLSSAHVYLSVPDPRLSLNVISDQSIDADQKFALSDWQSIPEALLIDLAQLVKANSIEGNKKDNITIVYTPWSNLLKTNGMQVGQVSCLSKAVIRHMSHRLVLKRKKWLKKSLWSLGIIRL